MRACAASAREKSLAVAGIKKEKNRTALPIQSTSVTTATLSREKVKLGATFKAFAAS